MTAALLIILAIVWLLAFATVWYSVPDRFTWTGYEYVEQFGICLMMWWLAPLALWAGAAVQWHRTRRKA